MVQNKEVLTAIQGHYSTVKTLEERLEETENNHQDSEVQRRVLEEQYDGWSIRNRALEECLAETNAKLRVARVRGGSGL